MANWYKQGKLSTIDDYNYVNANRTHKKGGGVGIYVTKNLQFKTRDDLTTTQKEIAESIFIELMTQIWKNIIIGVIYRPPNGKFEAFEKLISEILNKTDKENKICYMMGEFNIDLSKAPKQIIKKHTTN